MFTSFYCQAILGGKTKTRGLDGDMEISVRKIDSNQKFIEMNFSYGFFTVSHENILTSTCVYAVILD